MTWRKVSVVWLDTGRAEQIDSATPTTDVPLDIASHASEAAVDADGHLVYRALGGGLHVCIAAMSEVRVRKPLEQCLVAGAGHDETGWLRLDLCVITNDEG